MFRHSYSQVPGAPLSQSHLVSGPVGATRGSVSQREAGTDGLEQIVPDHRLSDICVLIGASGRVPCC
jgi:hypothetical protein